MGKKRLLIFIPTFPVVSETFILREVQQLVERNNFDITVVALKQGKVVLPQDLESVVKYERLNPISALFGLFYLILKPLRSFEALRILGVGRAYLFIKSLGYSYIFSKYKPNIIYSHFLSTPSTVALVASTLLVTELAIAGHARDVLEYPDLVKEKIKHAKFVVVCNKNAQEKIIELGSPVVPSNLYLVRHGIEDDFEKTQEQTSQIPTILAIGRLEEKKGHKFLIDAFKMLKDKNVEFKGTIVGGGNLERDLEKQIKDNGLKDNVNLTGSMPFDKVRKLLTTADIFVLPSINTDSGDQEGIPNTLIEAAMSKTPIITTDAGSITEFLNEGSASIVAQGDANQIANAIVEILQDNKESVRHKVESAYIQACDMFDIDSNIEELEKLLLG